MMRRSTRAARALTALALILSLTACGGDRTGGKSLYRHGLEVADVIAEMARSEDYLAMYGAIPEVAALAADAGQGDFTKPKAVYRITIPASAVLTLLGEEEGLDLKQLSPALGQIVQAKLQSAFITQINAQAGQAAIAAASVCTAQKLFVSKELTENTIYLYTYENAVPVAVAFTGGADGAVSASGMLVLNENFTQDAVQALAQYEETLGIQVEEVKG